MEAKPTRPPNYLALAIISTILCCIVPGIVSIIYSTQVNSAYDMGDYDKAMRASKNAKTWGIVAIAIAAVGWIIYIAIFGLAFIGLASSGEF